jgi:hypothetical protein
VAEPELVDWLRRALTAAGVDPAAVGDLCSAEAVGVILDLARDAAHGVARPAAPLGAFAAGVAAGRDADLERLSAVAQAIAHEAAD